MLQRALIAIIFIFTSSCGYEPLLSKKNAANYQFSIKDIVLEGDRDVNLKIKQKLNSYTLKKLDKEFSLKINSTSQRIISEKNIQGDPTTFKTTVLVYVIVVFNNNSTNNLQFEKSFQYKNIPNKFDLKIFEKELKINLTETIVDQLTFKLSNIQ